MNACRSLPIFLLILALGASALVPAHLAAEKESDSCSDCDEGACQDCSRCPDCTVSQLQAPAIPQPTVTDEPTETDSSFCTRSEEPILRQAASGIFRPPRTC